MTRFVFIFLTAVLTMGALPPVSKDQLKQDADLVISGTVTAEFSRVVPIRSWTNREQVLLVAVDGVEKGSATIGTIVYLHVWTTETRPKGWAGDGGHRGLPSIGERGLFHIKRATNGMLHVIGPNGGSVIKAVPPTTQ